MGWFEQQAEQAELEQERIEQLYLDYHLLEDENEKLKSEIDSLKAQLSRAQSDIAYMIYGGN